MPRARKLWYVRPHDEGAIRRLAGELKASPVVAQLLINRGVTDAVAARRFLDPSLAALHPPELLPGVPEAADRIIAAVRAKRPICVYGDYDADGITGTALLVRILQYLGGAVTFYIPHRLDEGYGLNADALRQLAADGAAVVVTVDCGITAVAEAEEANRLGVELIITDHHEPAAELPAAAAIVHPRLPGTAYPFGDLSGSGVALKLAWGIAQRASGGVKVTPELRELLLDAVGVAALGLVADVVPLRDENRILVKHGLARLVTNPPLGIRALVEAAKMDPAKIKAEDVSFKLAPRMNAAGRLGCALLVVELLATKSPGRAREIAEVLEEFNTQRQTIERRIAAEARTLVEMNGYDGDPAIVLAAADWHQGVVGIVAGRLADQYARPVVLVSLKPEDEISTGSGRSVPGFELHEALRACTALLEGHGGHAAAAGVRIRPSRLIEFRAKMNEYAATVFPDGVPAPRLALDAEVPLSALTFGMLRDIDKLEPYGAENPRPRFLAAGLTVEGAPKRIGVGERHLSFRVRQAGSTIRAIAFGMGDRLDELMSAGGVCCLAFAPKLNEWNGQRSVEIEVADMAAGAEPGLVS